VDENVAAKIMHPVSKSLFSVLSLTSFYSRSADWKMSDVFGDMEVTANNVLDTAIAWTVCSKAASKQIVAKSSDPKYRIPSSIS
jgi:F0F1-type ATP synthase assembly protein I